MHLCATAMYFILVLRVGNEKGKDEADTVDCCPYAANRPTQFRYLRLLCDDSIQYYNRANFMRDKQDSDGLFGVNVSDAKLARLVFTEVASPSLVI